MALAMRYVSFEEFIQKLKKNDGAWTITVASDGLMLFVTEKDVRRSYHSPDPIDNTDADWGVFAQRIGAVIDMLGSKICMDRPWMKTPEEK